MSDELDLRKRYLFVKVIKVVPCLELEMLRWRNPNHHFRDCNGCSGTGDLQNGITGCNPNLIIKIKISFFLEVDLWNIFIQMDDLWVPQDMFVGL